MHSVRLKLGHTRGQSSESKYAKRKKLGFTRFKGFLLYVLGNISHPCYSESGYLCVLWLCLGLCVLWLCFLLLFILLRHLLENSGTIWRQNWEPVFLHVLKSNLYWYEYDVLMHYKEEKKHFNWRLLMTYSTNKQTKQ